MCFEVRIGQSHSFQIQDIVVPEFISIPHRTDQTITNGHWVFRQLTRHDKERGTVVRERKDKRDKREEKSSVRSSSNPHNNNNNKI